MWKKFQPWTCVGVGGSPWLDSTPAHTHTHTKVHGHPWKLKYMSMVACKIPWGKKVHGWRSERVCVCVYVLVCERVRGGLFCTRVLVCLIAFELSYVFMSVHIMCVWLSTFLLWVFFFFFFACVSSVYVCVLIVGGFRSSLFSKSS